MFWITLLIVIVMLGAAIAVLAFDNLLAALAASSVVSLGLSVLFVILRAPDVAMTEATVGAGISGLVFAMTLRRLGLWRIDGSAETGADGEPAKLTHKGQS